MPLASAPSKHVSSGALAIGVLSLAICQSQSHNKIGRVHTSRLRPGAKCEQSGSRCDDAVHTRAQLARDRELDDHDVAEAASDTRELENREIHQHLIIAGARQMLPHQVANMWRLTL